MIDSSVRLTLQNYLPLASQPRLSSLTRKRKEYSQLVAQYFARGLGGLDQAIWHQIEIDVPRTRPGVPLWACGTAQKALERILYVWAIRHPASGYVQGINDLVCPFFQVFLGAYIGELLSCKASSTLVVWMDTHRTDDVPRALRKDAP